MTNDEWRMTNDEWWMTNDEWRMMNDKSSRHNYRAKYSFSGNFQDIPIYMTPDTKARFIHFSAWMNLLLGREELKPQQERIQTSAGKDSNLGRRDAYGQQIRVRSSVGFWRSNIKKPHITADMRHKWGSNSTTIILLWCVWCFMQKCIHIVSHGCVCILVIYMQR